jgi:hypothetical protein
VNDLKGTYPPPSNKRPLVALTLAAITALALLVALGLILFSVNPSVDRNEEGLHRQQAELRKAVMSQHAIICAQVQNTANAYRFRSLTPSGDVEPIRHFLTRMQAQQQTLRLARGSKCRSAPGFPPVGLQVRRALRQIYEILQHFEPALREPIREPSSHTPGDNTEGYRRGSFLPGVPKPSHAGVDESGVPAHLHDELAPGAPAGPQARHEQKPVPEPGASEVPVPAESAEAPKEETREVEAPGRPTLPTLPIKVEISIEETEVP